MNFMKFFILLCLVISVVSCEEKSSREVPKKDVEKSKTRIFLNSHAEAAAMTDYLLRCKSIPYPAGAKWNKETVDAFCDDAFTPTLTWEEVYSLIENGKGVELDAKYDQVIAGYFAKRIPEGAMMDAYSNSFGGTSSEKQRLIEQWLAASPESSHALTVRGMVNVYSAWQFRGGEFIQETPKDQIIKMKEKVNLAIADLKMAIAINPKVIPAYRSLMSASKMIGNKKLAEEYLGKLKKVDPYNYYVLYAYAIQYEPRWGGSLEEMDEIAKDAQLLFDENPRVANLLSWNKYYPSITPYLEKDYKSAQPVLEEAFKYGPHGEVIEMFAYTTKMLKDDLKAVELYSERLRFRPNDASVYTSRAASLIELSIFDMARRDLDRAKIIYPNYIYAIQSEIRLDLRENKSNDAQQKLQGLLNKDPNDLWALETMVWLSIYKTQDEPLGREMIDRGLALNPNSSVFCWFNWELARRTNGKNLKEATQAFIKNIDKTDPRQVEAFQYVEL